MGNIYFNIKIPNEINVININNPNLNPKELNFYFKDRDENNNLLTFPILDSLSDWIIELENGNSLSLQNYIKLRGKYENYIIISKKSNLIKFSDFYIPSNGIYYTIKLPNDIYNLIRTFGIENFSYKDQLYNFNLWETIPEDGIDFSKFLFFLYSNKQVVQMQINVLQLKYLKDKIFSNYQLICSGACLLNSLNNILNIDLIRLNKDTTSLYLKTDQLLQADNEIVYNLIDFAISTNVYHTAYITAFNKFLTKIYKQPNFSLILNQDNTEYFLYYGYINNSIKTNMLRYIKDYIEECR